MISITNTTRARYLPNTDVFLFPLPRGSSKAWKEHPSYRFQVTFSAATLLRVSIKVKIQSHRGGARARSPRFSVGPSLYPKPGVLALNPTAIATRSSYSKHLGHEGRSNSGRDDHRSSIIDHRSSLVRQYVAWGVIYQRSMALPHFIGSLLPPPPASLWVKNDKTHPPKTLARTGQRLKDHTPSSGVSAATLGT